MEPTEDSETSAKFKRTPGIYPKEHIKYSKPDESLKSIIFFVFVLLTRLLFNDAASSSRLYRAKLYEDQ